MIKDSHIKKYDPAIYNNIALNDLVTYAVFFLSESEERISYENITAACFLLFPERFCLRGYPNWPDSSVVNKRWIDCRNKGFIAGSTAQDFSLTPKGLAFAEKVGKELSGDRKFLLKRKTGKSRSELRTRSGRFLRSIEETVAYKLYKRDGLNASIVEFDFRSMLMCTMESTAKTLSENLEQFKQYANEFNRKDISSFLEYCSKAFIHLLAENSGNIKKYKGGMIRRKV